MVSMARHVSFAETLRLCPGDSSTVMISLGCG